MVISPAMMSSKGHEMQLVLKEDDPVGKQEGEAIETETNVDTQLPPEAKEGRGQPKIWR